MVQARKPPVPQAGGGCDAGAEQPEKAELALAAAERLDPGLAALCDSGGALTNSPELFSEQPLRLIAEEICHRIAEPASQPKERD